MRKPKQPKQNNLTPTLALLAAFIFSMILLQGCSREKVEFKERPQTVPSQTDDMSRPERTNPENPETYDPEGTARIPDSDSSADFQTGNINNDTNGNVANNAFAAPTRTVPRPVIPGGRTLTVRLLETISSKTASAGQHFDAELAAPVVINGKTVLPRRTPMRGRVVSARSSGRLKSPGYLRLTLDSVRTPDGKWVSIKTTSIWAQGKSHKKRNLTLIGGGTGLGAVIGAVAGGGKGAAIGAAAGAGAGTAGAYATGKKDVVFPAERKLSFSTVREVFIG